MTTIIEFSKGWGPSGLDQLALHVEECRPVPLGPSHLLVFSGAAECVSHLPRAKKDGFIPILTVNVRLKNLPMYHAVGISRRCVSRFELGLVRLRERSGDAPRTLVEVQVIKGLKPPRLVCLSGMAIIHSRICPSPIQRSLESISTAKKFLLDSNTTVNISRTGNLVSISSCFSCAFDTPYKELVQIIPAELRPKTELEFSVPFGYSLCSFKVYPDGRMLVESVPSSFQGTVSVNVKFVLGEIVKKKENIIALSEGAQTVAGQELVCFQPIENIFLLQGKVMLDTQSLGMVAIGKLPESAKPPLHTARFFVRNTLKGTNPVAVVQVGSDGSISASPIEESGSTSYLRILSLSAISWSSSHKPGDQHLLFLSRLTEADRNQLIERAAEAVSDAAMRKGAVSLFQGAQIPSSTPAMGPWAEKMRLIEDKQIRADPGVAMGIAKILVKFFDLVKNSVFQESFETSPEPAPPKRPLRRSHHATVMAFDVFRFNGRKSVHQVQVARNAGGPELEKLAQVIAWWNQWSTNEKFLTHSSLMGNHDVFTDTGKWSIPDDPAIQAELFAHMAWIYKRGYDTFISEIQTPLFPLIEDLDMESSLPMTDTSHMDSMFLDQSLSFIKERARALKVMYPDHSEFTCYVFSSSGFNKSKGRWKSSFHLVWPDLIVNGELAPIIRQTTVEYFIYQSQTSVYFKHMQSRLVGHYPANLWENVFDQTTSNANNGLRMPFCNKATWSKTETGSKTPSVENRRCYPKGAIKIRFDAKKFESPQVEIQAKEKALSVIIAAEARDAAANSMSTDQNALVGDRTKIKQADKNTTHRTSAFIAGMKSNGGDLKEFYNVTAKWTERVEDVNALSEAEVAVWIQRGSCRRQHGSVTLSNYNKNFVQCYLEADLVWFQGHTIETIRESEKYKQLTPAGQQGLKIRFKKYLQSQAGGGFSATVGHHHETDLARLHELAQKVRLAKSIHQPVAEEDEDEDDRILFQDEKPPTGDDEIELFDLWGSQIDNLFSFHESIAVWETKVKTCFESAGYPEGYWVHTPFTLTWICCSDSGSNTSQGWGCFTTRQRGRSVSNEQITVSLYYHCGKVLVRGRKESVEFKKIIKSLASVAKPDDRLYHKLSYSHAYNDGGFECFPLLDVAGARTQREEFKLRWRAMEDTSVGSDEAEDI